MFSDVPGMFLIETANDENQVYIANRKGFNNTQSNLKREQEKNSTNGRKFIRRSDKIQETKQAPTMEDV